MTAVDNAAHHTKTFQKNTYIAGVQLLAWCVAFVQMFMFYGVSYFWWWPFAFGNTLFVNLAIQFLSETIEGKQWSKVDWKLVFTGCAKHSLAFSAGSPLIWYYIIKVHECADLKGPMQYFCTQDGGKEASAYYSPDHNIWNMDTIAWLSFVPMLLAKMVVYELFLDFGFYTQHRLWHTVPWLYRLVHKQHHTLTDVQRTGEDPLLKSWHTLNMDISEIVLILAIHIPCMAFVGICVFGSHPLLRITGLDVSFVWGYVVLGEYTGHVDSSVAGTNAIPAGVIISFLFGLPHLGAQQHALHHNVVLCNYGKRFQVWDSLFGTMAIPEGGVGQWRAKNKSNHI